MEEFDSPGANSTEVEPPPGVKLPISSAIGLCEYLSESAILDNRPGFRSAVMALREDLKQIEPMLRNMAMQEIPIVDWDEQADQEKPKH